MKKIIKLEILIITGFLLLQNSHSQVRSDLIESIKKKFQNYTTAVPREEIFIHSDRDEYIAGENLWFKVYLIDRQTSMPSLNSRIVYFELLNSENRPVAQKRILIDKGTGPGQTVLPDTLSPGTYTIRAYTSWMKNFLPDNCFMKDIKIYNSLINKPFKNRTYNSDHLFSGKDNPDIKYKTISPLILKINNQRDDTLELFVTSDKSFRSENNNRIILFIQTRGNINRAGSEQILSENAKISVAKNDLIPGINHITIFDSKGEPVCERYIYTRDKTPGLLTLKSADSNTIRSKISLRIESDSVIPDSLSLQNLSISIIPFTGGEKVRNIVDYMVPGTEFGMQVLNSEESKKLSELSAETIDQLLLNLKSNWINWPGILSDKLPEFKFVMEKEDHILSGRLIVSEPELQDASGYILMCSPGKKPGFQYATADKAGNFSFNLHIDEGVNDLIFMPDNTNTRAKLLLESSFSGIYADSKVSPDTSGSPEPSHIQMMSANYQINKIYNIVTPGKQTTPLVAPLKPLGFYGKPDIEIVLADYISLPTMEEIFFEIVPHVSLRKKRGGYEISVADRVDDNPLNLSPCLLIDGVIVRDASLIAGLNPEIIEKIDVIKEIYVVGNYTFPGLVNIVTKAADYNCVALDDYMIRLKYRVTDTVFEFPSPDYSYPENINLRIPDFRNTMYWNPSINKTGKGYSEVSLWTSDIPSKYIINIEGISCGGKPVSVQKLITVDEN